jgi:hypothetical protein
MLAVLVLVVRSLAGAHVLVPVGGLVVAVPALAIAAVTVTAMAAAVTALVVYRIRADRATLAAWQASKAAAR